jgi:hypothetical protein
VNCPEWCIETHEPSDLTVLHQSDSFGSRKVRSQPWITQSWDKWQGLQSPQITIMGVEGSTHFSARQARAIADLIGHTHSRSTLAAALCQAADALDDITGGDA